ncbi:MAG TPA: amino acid permease [Gemmatimonadaceae bacterium]|nr:amino acid permease [Gemmatimonadaceae bacterium]
MSDRETAPLARRLGAFDATMLVMGGIVGAGIFMNPSVVARAVQSPVAILGAWALGGLVALTGAFVYAELAVRRPGAGGQYLYLRDAFHPIVAFLYGWTLLLVSQSGGMAAVAMTFAGYFRELTGVSFSPAAIAVATLALLTVVNCFGARAGSNVQSTLMVLKIAAIVMLVTVGWAGIHAASGAPTPAASAVSRTPLLAFAAAMVPVLFAYGGWQTASFVGGELRNPERDLPRGLLYGVLGVIVLYLAVNAVCLTVLGPAQLAATSTPATAVMQRALGPTGAKLIAAGIAISTLGFLSQGMLTAPRVYYAMARDGVFFRRVAAVHPVTRAPIIAIVLQGVWAAVIALSGKYDAILAYVVAIDALFFGLTGAALIVFRRRESRRRDAEPTPMMRMPGHPVTTTVFVLAFWTLAIVTVAQFPRSAGAGMLILLAGVPAFYAWRLKRARGQG